MQEVGEQLKLNPRTVRNMIDREELRVVRVGSRRVRHEYREAIREESSAKVAELTGER